MKLKKCIKIRVPSNDGWKDVRCEYYKEHDCFYGLTDYDRECLRAFLGSQFDFVVESAFINTAVSPCDKYIFEVTWQSDSWPQ